MLVLWQSLINTIDKSFIVYFNYIISKLINTTSYLIYIIISWMSTAPSNSVINQHLAYQILSKLFNWQLLKLSSKIRNLRWFKASCTLYQNIQCYLKRLLFVPHQNSNSKHWIRCTPSLSDWSINISIPMHFVQCFIGLCARWNRY